MRVLVTGASGFVGRAVLDRLRADDCQVVAVSRGPAPDVDCAGVTWRRTPGLEDTEGWRELLEGIDNVIHLAARAHVPARAHAADLDVYRLANVELTRVVATQARAVGVRRVVFVSSIKVMGELGDQPFRETDPTAPHDAYGISKLEAEEVLVEILASGPSAYTIVRPPLVYGPGVKANLHKLTLAVARGWPLPFGSVDNRRSMISTDNLADLLTKCLYHRGAVNQLFLASDGEDLSTPDLVRLIARAAGRPPRLVPVPVGVLRMGLRWAGQGEASDKLLGSLVVDSSRARRVLDWRPPGSVSAGLSAMTHAAVRAPSER